MKEDILHFLWKNNPSVFNGLKCEGLGIIEVISSGEHNFDSGPDFFNAKIKAGNTVWAGNVEMHINASDWNKHGHQNDPAYDSVILHIVTNVDATILNSKGKQVPTIQISFPHELEWSLLHLMATEAWIPCANHIKHYNPLSLRMWLSSIAVERLEAKTEQVSKLVEESKGSWEDAFYISMARSFGLKINALPFEMLAKATPLRALAKVKDNLHSIEALLFGQAGMLSFDAKAADDYMLSLKKEYDYQSKKFSLSPIPQHLWKYMRLRPASFPTIRIAQFAQLIHQSVGLFSHCLEAESFTQIADLLKVSPSNYWQHHYSFGKPTSAKGKSLGDDRVRTIMINTIVPFTFAYGAHTANQGLKDKSLSFLDLIKAESNNVVKGFTSLGVKADSAFFSQAMVHLKGEYCDKRKCLYCQVGVNLLLKKI